MAGNVEFPRARLAVLAVVAVALFSGLVARMWYLQVLDETPFVEVAEASSTRVLYEPAPRGQIFDRNGNVLVGNRPSIQVVVDSFTFNQELTTREEQQEVLLRLAREISRTGRLTKVADVEAEVYDPKYGRFDLIPVARDVTEEFQILLAERSEDFPGITTTVVPVRTYPYGTLAAHVLGYAGPVDEAELETLERQGKEYQPNDVIGKFGVELIYEDQLRGEPGRRVIEIDAQLNPIRVLEYDEPEAGNDLQLTLDVDLQALVEDELETSLVNSRRPAEEFGEAPFNAPAGASVVLDPEGSEVLAMASYPTFDPQEFIDGISQESYDLLNDEASHFPLLNRAIQGLYAPGSTFKPFTAYAAMNTGLIGPRGSIGIDDTIMDNGIFTVPNCEGRCEFPNAGETAYGPIALADALTVSSDVYFYNLAYWFDSRPEFRPEMITEGAELFGFGALTGVPLAAERPGYLPTRQSKAARNAEDPEAFPEGRWFTADTINTSIGQGDINVTPLQLANGYAVWANGGTLYAPNVASAVLDPLSGQPLQEFGHRVLSTLYMPDSIWEPVHAGLLGVTQDVFDETFRGTAYDAFEGFPHEQFPVAAKTGTSEKPPKADFALFAAYAPAEEPEYVVTTVLEEAGFGGEQAAPPVRRILEAIATNSVPEATPLEDLRGLTEEASPDDGVDEVAQGGGG